jgi:tetratricopeptide (TPR) repeat protein
VKPLPILNSMVAAVLALLPGTAPTAACQIAKKAEIALGYVNGLATVEAKIDGTAVIMGLDTGSQTLVTPQIADELRLMPGLNRTLARGSTAVTVAGQVILRDFEFAGAHYDWKSVIKIKLPTPKVPNLKVKPAAGLIGMDVLANYDLDFDFPHRKLTLYSVRGCQAAPPSDYTDVKTIPFKINGERNIFFPVELDGHKITALLDTGAVFHMITHAGVKKAGGTEAMLKADPTIETGGVGNISLKHPLHTFGKLTIGGVEHSSVPFGVLARSLSQGDALIGQVYLFTRRFRISNATRTLYVENKPRTPAYGIQAFGSPSLVPPAGAPALADVCSHSTVLRLRDFCDKGAGVPAAALGGPLPAPVAPPQSPLLAPSAAPAQSPAQGSDLGAAVATDPPKPTQQASITPPPAPFEPHWREPQMFAYGFIGTGIAEISQICGQAMGLPAGTGLLVRGFSTESTGEKAGLRRGDIITALEGQPVTVAYAFLEAIRKIQPGQKVRLTVWRDKEEKILETEVSDSRTQPQDNLSLDGRAAYRVEAGEAVLAMLPEGACVQERAISLVFLGGAYSRRTAAEGAADYHEQAIKYLEQGLALLNPIKYQGIWASGYTRLGTAYRLRSAGVRSDNIERSIKAYEEAILVRQAFVARNDRGDALMGLGLALLARSAGTRSENIERAIGCFELAKQAFDSKADVKDWADLHRALASAYLERSEGQRQQNLDAAIAALETASGALSPGEGGAAERSAMLTQLMQLKAQRLAAPAKN